MFPFATRTRPDPYPLIAAGHEQNSADVTVNSTWNHWNKKFIIPKKGGICCPTSTRSGKNREEQQLQSNPLRVFNPNTPFIAQSFRFFDSPIANKWQDRHTRPIRATNIGCSCVKAANPGSCILLICIPSPDSILIFIAGGLAQHHPITKPQLGGLFVEPILQSKGEIESRPNTTKPLGQSGRPILWRKTKVKPIILSL